MTTLTAFLVRHCEASGQEPEAPLTQRGRGQAERLAAALRTRLSGGVISSPYRRARQTAQPLVGTGVELEIDDRLREWELPWIPAAEWPRALRSIFAGELPVGVESLADARARGLAAVRETRARARSCALVTHGKLLALLLSELQGRDPFDVFTEIRTPHVFEVRDTLSGMAVCGQWSLD